MQKNYLTNWERLQVEIRQAQEEGKEIKNYFLDKIKAIEDEEDSVRERYAGVLLDELISLPIKKDYPYVEPNSLEEIKRNRTEGLRRVDVNINEEELYNKIYGAWLGRIAGMWLGQPFEGFGMSKGKDGIKDFLKHIEKWPLEEYIDFTVVDEEIFEKYGFDKRFKNYSYDTGHALEDDDINYTVLNLEILKTYGPNFTSEDVAEGWLKNLPIFRTYTAERVAYSNLCQLIMPPQSAIYRNPYREWIGAQIRADLWGYVNPGNMEKAAEYALRDASISHTKNGIYGEMFVAAMVAASFVMEDPVKIIEAGLREIPDNCRLYHAIQDVLKWSREEKDWESCLNLIYKNYGHYNAVHTINNACIVALALLYGEGDFGKSIDIAVMGGWDTDCNAATVGSIMGAMLGEKRIPEKWKKPVRDTVETGIIGYGKVKVSDLAKLTLGLSKN
ncbi:MAG TPA: ADP-ribosylglycohydrolase family protein [Clostridia bacterium]|nr:ADP-ribosylglycohydrolase family protein [Clostridia bacterium]